MCQNCKSSSCDLTCRNDLYCKLNNANQDDIIKCRNYNFIDEEYGLQRMISTTQNLWVTKEVVPEEEEED